MFSFGSRLTLSAHSPESARDGPDLLLTSGPFCFIVHAKTPQRDPAALGSALAFSSAVSRSISSGLVRNSIALVRQSLADVRFTPGSGHRRSPDQCPLSANSGHRNQNPIEKTAQRRSTSRPLERSAISTHARHTRLVQFRLDLVSGTGQLGKPAQPTVATVYTFGYLSPLPAA